MPVVKTQKANLDDVLKWSVHEAYCIELVTLSNSDVALVAGDTILGHLAWYTGSVWKVLDSGDVISGTSLICPILYTRAMTGAVAADAVGFLKNVPILRRGHRFRHTLPFSNADDDRNRASMRPASKRFNRDSRSRVR